MSSEKNLKELSKKIGKLPTLPGVAIKILQAMQREAPDIGEIAEVISADAPLSANVLRVVNSPFYGLSNKITSVHHAMVYLGLNTVKTLALSFSLLRGLRPRERAHLTMSNSQRTPSWARLPPRRWRRKLTVGTEKTLFSLVFFKTLAC
jgi:HD-like signal output (HDOD) protein